MLRIAFAALAGIVLQTAPAPNPQTAALPSARELVARDVAAIGGEAAFKAVKSMRERGKLDITAQGISGEFEILQARPAKMYQRLTVPGMGVLELGYDGKIGWTIDPQSGPALLAGRQFSELAEDAWFDAPLHQASRYKELTTVERTEFDRRPAFKVKAVFVSGLEEDDYFDAETGFEIGWEASRATPSGILPTSATYRDYKRFGSLMLPSTVVLRQLGADQIMRLTSCEFNVVPSSAFDLPKSIKALIK